MIKKAQSLLWMVLLARIFVPLLLFISPLFAFVTSVLFDAVDGQISFESKLRWAAYNRNDKILDYWWYLGIVAYFWVKIPELFSISVLLLLFRTIGQIIGIVLRYEKIYLLFPNILELFFLFRIVLPTQNVIVSICCATLLSLVNEFIIHFSNAHIVSKYIIKREIKWELNERRSNKKVSKL